MSSSVDPKSRFDPSAKTFHSHRLPASIPPQSHPISVTSYVFSLLKTLPSFPAIIDSSTDTFLSFPALISQTNSLSSSLISKFNLSKGNVAFILSPTSPRVPVLYFALFSIGVVVTPSNPLGSSQEIEHQISLSKPSIVFATKDTASKVPSHMPTVLLDSEQFSSFLDSDLPPPQVEVFQSDPSTILFSSGTTGKVKGVVLTHGNFIALIAGFKMNENEEAKAKRYIGLCPVPLFHVFGVLMCIRTVALEQTMVLMDRFDFEKMLQAVQKYKATRILVSPPLVVALAKSPLVDKYDLSSLELIGSGGGPLGKEVAEKFKERFPNIEIGQGYGLTESSGGIVTQSGPKEYNVWGSVGRIEANVEAKIIDPTTGEALGPGQQGELWFRGPMIMAGYVGDDAATASTVTSDGWLKTGDLCYFDNDGFLFIVDRLKELIKYKGYQVPPAELEQILQSNKEIADAAVISYPDEEAGEIPMAFVARQPGSKISEKQVMDFVAKQVAPYKKVRKVYFVSSIPKSPAGKILRRELTKHALSKPKSKL